MKEADEEVAKAMKDQGMDIQQIAQYTGLSPEDITKL